MGRFTMDSALGVETLERVVGYGPAALERARRRAATLAAIVHPGVLAPAEVRTEPDGSVVAVMPRIDGDDVATLVLARGGLRVGECVSLGIGAAGALAAMHRAGLAHGDVSAANIMVGGNMVTLVDTMGGAEASEEGTPGFQAPDRAVGPSAPADVYALGMVLRSAVRDADAERIEAWVTPMLAPDPSVRPSAAMVARALASCATPEPIERPMLGVAGALRARAASTELAKTVRRDHGRSWRAWRRARRWGAMGGSLLAVALLAIAVAPRVVAWAYPPEPPGYDPAMPIPAHAAVGAEQAVRNVTQARFDAISASDADALRATTVPGSPARAELEPVASALEAGDLSVEGLWAVIDEVEIVSAAGRRMVAEITYTVAAHTVWDAEGGTHSDGYSHSAELDLLWSDAGWQVERVREVESAP
jgi:serine/threonine protein kinase